MANELKGLTREEALRLAAEARQLEAEAYGHRAKLLEAYAATGDLPVEKAPGSSNDGDLPDNALVKLPLTDAIIYALRAADGPRKPAQIAKDLIAAGRKFEIEDPLLSVGNMLRKAALSNSDIAYVAAGAWTLKSKYRTADFNRLVKKRSGRGGRSKEEHARLTKEAMIAKGLKFGRKPKFGPEDIAKFRNLVENEGMRPMAALKEVGISTPYYYQYKEQIYAWKPGDPWPPTKQDEAQGASSDELRAMGVIPMHAHVVGKDK